MLGAPGPLVTIRTSSKFLIQIAAYIWQCFFCHAETSKLCHATCKCMQSTHDHPQKSWTSITVECWGPSWNEHICYTIMVSIPRGYWFLTQWWGLFLLQDLRQNMGNCDPPQNKLGSLNSFYVLLTCLSFLICWTISIFDVEHYIYYEYFYLQLRFLFTYWAHWLSLHSLGRSQHFAICTLGFFSFIGPIAFLCILEPYSAVRILLYQPSY